MYIKILIINQNGTRQIGYHQRKNIGRKCHRHGAEWPPCGKEIPPSHPMLEEGSTGGNVPQGKQSQLGVWAHTALLDRSSLQDN